MTYPIIIIGTLLDLRPVERALLRHAAIGFTRVPDAAAAAWLLSSRPDAIVICAPGALPMPAATWREQTGARAVIETAGRHGWLLALRLWLARRTYPVPALAPVPDAT